MELTVTVPIKRDITQNMLDQLNAVLEDTAIEVVFDNTLNFKVCHIQLRNQMGLDSYMIYISRDTWNRIVDFFKAECIEIEFNNVGSYFWSTSI